VSEGLKSGELTTSVRFKKEERIHPGRKRRGRRTIAMTKVHESAVLAEQSEDHCARESFVWPGRVGLDDGKKKKEEKKGRDRRMATALQERAQRQKHLSRARTRRSIPRS